MKTKLLFAGIVFLLTITRLNATNYYISTSGSDSNNGLTPSTSFQSIQTATNIVVAGDCVLVMAGHYPAGFNHADLNNGSAGMPIVYKAIGSVVFDAGSAHGHNAINVEDNDYIHIIGFRASKMFTLYNTNSNVCGIRIVNSDYSVIRNNICDSDGTGILTAYCDHLTIEYNTCRYNGGTAGQHGIYHSNGGDYATIRYNTCTYNYGAGIQFNPDFSSQDQPNDGLNTGSVVSYNILAHDHIGLNTQGLVDCIISNNLIYDYGNNGMTFYHHESSGGTVNTKIFNNTIVANNTGNWAIFLENEVTSMQIYNNIMISVSGSGGSTCFYDGATGKSYTSNYNIVSNLFCDVDASCSETFLYWQGLGYEANSILAPALTALFVDPANEDYHLKAGSVAIDAGTSLVSADVTKDLDGMVRPAGGVYDIGCYEYNSVPAGIAKIYAKDNSALVITDRTASVKSNDNSADVTFYDVLGNLVYNGNNWNYSSSASGVYMYVIYSRKNNTRSAGKFVVNNL